MNEFSTSMNLIGIQRYLECVIEGNGKMEASRLTSQYHFGAGEWKARVLRKMARNYVDHRILPRSLQGKHQKIIPLIEDEDLMEQCLLFLRSQKPEQITALLFCKQLKEVIFPKLYGFAANVSERTASCWLHKLGFSYKDVSKSSYVDGHEREDVVAHRSEFLESMEKMDRLMPKYSGEEMEIRTELELGPGEKTIITVVQDESIFQAHDAKGKAWLEGEQQIYGKKVRNEK